jgi:hypothetical protein
MNMLWFSIPLSSCSTGPFGGEMSRIFKVPFSVSRFPLWSSREQPLGRSNWEVDEFEVQLLLGHIGLSRLLHSNCPSQTEVAQRPSA